MSAEILRAINRFQSTRVLVIGDLMLDRYLHGETNRIAQEAPVPVVALEGCREFPGGAANVAANARALGAEVTLVGLLGSDEQGSRLHDLLEATGIEVAAVRSRQTLTKTRVCAGDQVLVRYDEGGREELDCTRAAELAAAVRDAWHSADIVIISDYAYGAVPDGLLSVLSELRAESPARLAVDARDLTRFAALGPDVAKPDFRQACALAGCPPPQNSRAETLRRHASLVLDATGAATLCITLDCDGALICGESGQVEHVPAGHTGAAFSNGAGDTFLTAFALAQQSGLDARKAGEVASAAAAVVVKTPGTAICTNEALTARYTPSPPKVLTDVGLAAFVQKARARGRKIVFTNGVFDILHRGHTDYLAEAAALGDVLVVGLNDDDSVRRLKGPERPINALDERAALLAALGCVDAVVPFAEDTPERLIRIARPDVYVKGGDYDRARLREAALVESLGGSVVIAGYVPGKSTTQLIARTREEPSAVPARVSGHHDQGARR